MTPVAEWIKIDELKIAADLNAAYHKLNASDGELVLDWTSVARIDTAGLSALEKLALAADEKKIKLTFRGLNIDIYRVLKLARLSDRFLLLS
jgi:anti-anti-sigma regulatory factor